MSIEVKNVTKLYGEQKALNDISFTVEKGNVMGFIGPNGAGKSTTMKIITGYIPASEGKVLVNGLDINKEALKVRSLIGYLPEHNPLYPEMYVTEYLDYVAGIYKVPNRKERIMEMLEFTGLTLEMKKKISALSKGYRQRVGLAQALIHDPEVLILDEPTSGLDPNQIIEIRNLISKVGKEKTVMLSTHIMQEVEAICDSIIILKQGEIVANESAQNIHSTSKNNLQVVLLELNKDIETEIIEKIDNVETVAKVSEANYLIQSKKDIREQIFQFAVSNGLSVLSLQKQEKSLEELFQELTK